MKEKEIIKSEKSTILSVILICGAVATVLAIIIRVITMKDLVESLLYLICFDPFYLGFIFYIGAILTIFGLVCVLAYNKASLTVTDRRVYGTAAWGKRVDLPMDKISAVAKSFLGGISVSTSSGAIRFMGIKNNNEVHEAINKLLMERQEKEKSVATTTIKQEIPQSNADELKKYKELLDTGTITQEEFDAKKNQLLGL